ncbi:hypothetical protein KAR91_23365 [Candidatus Pacearchaeota archaeon]|nr:hypothetical protein [Candidatus Pacearchaeota archaeon]
MSYRCAGWFVLGCVLTAAAGVMISILGVWQGSLAWGIGALVILVILFIGNVLRRL